MDYQAVILAGGKGTRMQNTEIPKVLHALHEKPLIGHVLDSLQELPHDTKPVIVVGYQREKVMAELGDAYTYAIQEEQLGTGHALKCAEQFVSAKNVVVLYGDMPFVSSASLESLIGKHAAAGNKITMFTSTVPHFSDEYACFEKYGRILRDAHNQILGIKEYKDASDAEKAITEVNPGIYVFDTEWLWPAMQKVSNHNAQHEYYLTDMIEIAIREGHGVSSLNIRPQEVFGINTKDELQAAHEVFTQLESALSV